MSYRLSDYTLEQQVEIQRIIAGGGVEDFDGKNCDDCTGWDGESHRCNCGNRRMYWTIDDGGNVRAEAY